ncbi:MAG: hypothetical protein OEM52_04390 [bacterium]|nr:hypothetical protein [bacterium]
MTNLKSSKDKVAGTTPFSKIPQWGFDIGAGVGLYFAMALLLYPVMFLGQHLFLSSDGLTASAMMRAAQLVMDQTNIPLWNPYLFCGMPLFSAFQFGLFVNPIWYLVKPISFLFGGDAAIILFYMWLGGLGVYYVIREMGESRPLGFLSGLIWMWLPALVVLPMVGHGSKLMASAVLPWMLWGSLRVVKHDNWKHTGILALLVGLSVLSLHTQISYYGFMMIGWIVLWEIGCAIKDKKGVGSYLNIGKLILATGIGIGISMVLALPVLDFAAASSRGATGGGVDWEYATNWSFHPLETITFLWPTFYGAGGPTYWGHMPFTDMPLTFGVVALMGAVLAVWLKRDRLTWMLLILALVAWSISWGKFLPVTFKPLFEFLPMFKKFRVPNLILILTQLAMIVLAARGFGAVFKLVEDIEKPTFDKLKKFGIICIALFGLFLISSPIMSSEIKAGFVDRMKLQYPNVSVDQFTAASDAAWDIAFSGGMRSLLLLAALGGGIWLLAKGSFKPPIFIMAASLAVFIEFLPLIHYDNHPLVKFSYPDELETYFAPTQRLQYLKQQPGEFRVLVNDKARITNWWAAQGIQIAGGYSGVKLGSWDRFEKHQAMTSPNVWRALNIRYLTTDRQIQSPLITPVARDNEGFLYEVVGALPRTYFALNVTSVADQATAFDKMAAQDWEPTQLAFVEGSAPEHGLDSLATAQLTKWSIEKIEVKTHRANPGVLVLAEMAAPHWEVAVNGQPAKALIVNGMLRGVAVPAGDATVTWQYTEKEVFQKGMWLSLASAFLAILFIVVGVFLKRKSS